MRAMDIKAILNNWIVRNLLLAAGAVVVIIIVVSIFLSAVTRHNKEITVPDFTNLTFEEAQFEASHAGVRVEIGDSVFVRRMKKGAVFAQNPKAGSKVKKGRRILLTTNAKTAKQVSMPSLVGLSMRQAKSELAAKGLMLGRLVYVNDIATNNVLRQLYHNREIGPGAKIESGSVIDLVVGLNASEGSTYVPNVVGMKYMRAVDAVHDNSLNVVRLLFDSDVRNYSDSLNAVVYEQRPGPAIGALSKGAGISLYLSTDPEKVAAL